MMAQGIIPMVVGMKFPVGLRYNENDVEIGDYIVSTEVEITPPSGLKPMGTPVIQNQRDVSQMVQAEVANEYQVLFKSVTNSGSKFHDPDFDSVIVKVKK